MDILLISAVIILLLLFWKIAVFVYLVIRRILDRKNEDFEKRDY